MRLYNSQGLNTSKLDYTTQEIRVPTTQNKITQLRRRSVSKTSKTKITKLRRRSGSKQLRMRLHDSEKDQNLNNINKLYNSEINEKICSTIALTIQNVTATCFITRGLIYVKTLKL
jgi:hypothetical protein